MARFVRLTICALLLSGGVVHAQTDAAAQINTQQDVARRGWTEEVPADEDVSVADPDLGEINLVRRAPRPKMFTFSTTQSFHYTSNAFLLPDNELAALFWNGRFDASFVPYATRNLTPRLTFEQNFFRYDDVAELDFDSHSLLAEVKYDLTPDDSWFITGSYAVARLYSPRGDIDEFFRYGLLHASITHLRQLGQSGVYFAGTFGSNYRHGDPSEFDRITGFLNTAFLWSPIDHLQLSAFVRPEVQFYTNDPTDDSRTDLNLSVGASATVSPIEYVTVGLTASLIGNYSSADARDYEVFSPSIVLAGRIAF